jgi:4-hydroxy-3-polyprenylbenzoate decarboxylase
MTGASGAVFARQFLLLAERDHRVTRVNFIVSDNALRVAAEELGLTGRAHLVKQVLGKESKKIDLQNNADIGANVASGSYPTDAMVVIPCSMGTLARIATGTADRLIERAADVCLKERRKLILVPRETPLSLVHLRNLTAVTEAGAVVLPAAPGFYHKPTEIRQLVDFVVQRIVDQLGLEIEIAKRWGGD